MDADPANAASVNTPLQKLANYLAYLQAHGALSDVHNIFTALQTLNGVAGDASKILETTAAVTARKLVWELAAGGAGVKARIYLNVDGELEFTRNAWWDTTVSKWRADVWAAGPEWTCSMTVLSSTGLLGYAYGDDTNDLTNVANAWTTAAWPAVTRLNENGAVQFFGTIDGGDSNSNPPAAEAQANRLCAKNVPKTWANVHVVSGAVSVADGFNITYASKPDVNTIRFNFQSPMQSADYAVLTGMADELPAIIKVVAKTASTFDVRFWSVLSDTNLDISSITYKFDLVVFGRQDS